MARRLLFCWLYLRNLWEFGGSHTYAVAAAYMDLALHNRRKARRRA